MALVTSYSSLVTSVQTYLARSGLASDVPGFIQNWETRFLRQPKNFGRWMEADLTGAIASSVLAVPNDYLGLKMAYVNGNPASRLERVSLEMCYGRYPRGSGSSRPMWLSRERTNFVFGPEPDSNYTIKGVYWAKPTYLRDAANDAAAHWIIVNAPDLALYGALLEAEAFIKNDARVLVWKSFYADALQDYRDLHTEEDASNVSQEVLA